MIDPPRQTTDDEKQAEFQVELFGLKVKKAADQAKETEPDPQSWSEVAHRINKAMMSIVAGAFGLSADAIRGARTLVAGIASLPTAISNRIRNARDKADRVEAHQQESNTIPTLSEAKEQLERLLREHAAKGNTAKITRLPNGDWVVVVVRPELESDALSAADQLSKGALPPSPEEASSESPLDDLDAP